jgi:hypothetical protein
MAEHDELDPERLPKERNDFLRGEMERSAAEARRAVWAGTNPAPAPDDEDLFKAHTRRFPGQHE